MTCPSFGWVVLSLSVAAGDSRLNLWTRAFEVAQAELRRAFALPEPGRDLFLQWPPFSRKGFRETARQCAAVTEREGFTGASIDVIWDNADFHGGAKNMNVWDFLSSSKLSGEDLDAARHEVRQVVQDYRRVKDRMVHRFAHADGSGYTWTNDRDRTKVVWLLKDALLPDGRRGQAGQVHVMD